LSEAFCNFPDSKSGWGYDYEIAYRALERRRTIAVCDWSLARHRGESYRSQMVLGYDFDKRKEMEEVYGERFRDSEQVLNAAWDQMRAAALPFLAVGEQPDADWPRQAGSIGSSVKQFSRFPGQGSATLELDRTRLGTFESALAYTKAGISIIPILTSEAIANGSHRTPFDCREYIRHRIAAPEELREWFGGDIRFGLAAVLGPISEGLECLDLTFAAVAKLFRQLVIFQGGQGLLERLPAVRSTVEGRTRLYYRCPNPAPRVQAARAV
jgi:hypothetical protein